MSQFNVTVDDNLEKEFRIKVIEVFGGKRGSLKIATEEAMRLWIESKVDNNRQKKKKYI